MRPAAVMCVTTRERKVPLGDFIKVKGHANHNRYQALTLDVWQGLLDDVTSDLSPPSACLSIPFIDNSPSHGRIGATRLMKAQLAETRGGDGGIEPLASEPSGGSGGFCASRLLENVHLGPWDFHRH